MKTRQTLEAQLAAARRTLVEAELVYAKNVQENQDKWDSAPNPFVAVEQYCADEDRAERVKIYDLFCEASDRVKALEKRLKNPVREGCRVWAV